MVPFWLVPIPIDVVWTVFNNKNSITEAKIIVGLRYSWKKYISPPPTVAAITYVPIAVKANPTAIKIAMVERFIFTVRRNAPKMKYPAYIGNVKTKLFN